MHSFSDLSFVRNGLLTAVLINVVGCAGGFEGSDDIGIEALDTIAAEAPANTRNGDSVSTIRSRQRHTAEAASGGTIAQPAATVLAATATGSSAPTVTTQPGVQPTTGCFGACVEATSAGCAELTDPCVPCARGYVAERNQCATVLDPNTRGGCPRCSCVLPAAAGPCVQRVLPAGPFSTLFWWLNVACAVDVACASLPNCNECCHELGDPPRQ